jgi:hypothetical protein
MVALRAESAEARPAGAPVEWVEASPVAGQAALAEASEAGPEGWLVVGRAEAQSGAARAEVG